MATPEPQTYTAPYVAIDTEGGVDMLVTILEDGSLVIGGTPETHAKKRDWLRTSKNIGPEGQGN